MKKMMITAGLAAAVLGVALGAAPASGPASGPASAPGAGRGAGRGGGRGPGTPPVLSATHPAESPVFPGAMPVKLGENFGFTEGSTSDKAGNIFFVDQNNDKIMEWEFDNTSTDPLKGRMLVFMHPSGYSNGMCFDNDGNLISCADEKNELWSIAAPFPKHAADPNQGFTKADLKITTLIKDADGKLMNGPNDVWVIPTGPLAGGMYLGDPLYARRWWTGFRTPAMQQGGKYVWFLSADRKTLKPVITDYDTPNGIIGTPDGKTLYVSDINRRQTNSFTINNDGTLSDKKLVMNAGSDGMTIDSDGNLYTTSGQGMQIWSKEGKLLETIAMRCANVCFGGKDGDILFICANTEVYGVKMKTHKVGPQ